MADKPHITKEGYVAQLVRTGVWATPQNPIQYAFLEQKPAYLPNEPGWAALPAAQRAAVERAFAMIAEVVNLTFVQVPDNQQQPGPGNPRINFYANNIELSYSGGMLAYRVQGGPAIHGADIRFNSARIAQRQSNEGWQDFTSFVALHEVLHAMGLSHPGDYNGQGPTYLNNAEFIEDTVQYSVMSYFAAANTGADHSLGNVLYGGRTPLLYDILALQSLYSPNMSTRAGDTVYGFNSNTGATSPFNFAVTTGPVVAIWDGGGIDTIDLSGYATASLIDLNEGAFSDAGGLTKNIAIAFNVTIENAVGGPGADRLIGNGVANRLDGGAGADWMEGALGDDVYSVDDPGDVVAEAGDAGRDEVRTALATYVLPANVEWLTGTAPAAQTLTGNGLANTITGGAGDDTLSGGAGDDALEGGAGDGDMAVYAGNRADYEIGTAGQATVRDLNAADGDEGTDSLNGIEFVRFADMVVQLGVDPNNPPVLGQPAMADQVWADGQAAAYTIPGTSFVDPDGQHTLAFGATLSDGSPLPAWLSFDSSTRTFSGTPPLAAVGAPLTVRVTADDGKVSIYDDLTISVTQAPGADVNGTDGNDVLEGTFRAERMVGGDGDDVLRGSPGADILHGFSGTDQVDYGASPEGVTIDLTTGFGSGGHAEGDQLFAIEGATGSSHSDRITGTPGNDVIDGGAGADTMEGADGADLYLVDDPGDAVVERANEGTDEVRTSLSSLVLAANVEILTGLAATGQALTGNGLANLLTGGSGNDVLDGGAGADQLAGGLGNDVYIVGTGDSVAENAGEGTDEVRTALAAYTLGADLERLTGTAATGQVLTGNGLANILTGGGGNDVLDGGAGADQLAGGLGDDLYYIGDGDSVTEAAGAGVDEVRTAIADTVAPANVEKLTGLLDIAQTLRGNGLDNIIAGGAGADRMVGGLGNDVYLVGTGDNVIEKVGEGTDEVKTALAAYTLTAEVENVTGTSAAGQTLTGNSGHNAVTGGGGDDVLLMHGGGNDVANGGAGNDNIFFIGTLTTADVVNGGAGVDTLVVQGPYGSLTLTANVTQIENLSILGGNNTSFGEPGTNRYDYVLTTHDSNFAAGVQARINGSALLAGEDFTFNGSAETDASYVVYGGKGKDTLLGGLGNDIFFYAEERFASGDTVNGGLGYDGMFLRGNYTIDFNAPGYTGLFTNIENLTLTSATDERYARGGGTEFDYNLTLSNAIVGAGQELTVSGALLMVTETMILDGSQETDGRLRLFGGKGADTLKGGGQADLLHGALGADILSGGGGADAFRYQAVTESNAPSRDHIIDFTPGTDKIELDRIDANTGVGGDQAFAWIGSNAFSKTAGELRAYQSGANWIVEGDINGDGFADLVIALTLQGPTPLGAGDFLL